MSVYSHIDHNGPEKYHPLKEKDDKTRFTVSGFFQLAEVN